MKIKVSDKIYFNGFKLVAEKDGDYFVTVNGQAYLIDYTTEHILQLFRKYQSIENILKNTKYYSQKDLSERVEMFLFMKIIKQIGDVKFISEEIHFKNDFNFIKKDFAELFFSLPAKIFLVLISIFTLFIIAGNFNYFPKFNDFFFHHNDLICLIVSFVYGWVSTFRHEFFHFLAARSRGVISTFSIGTRLNFMVAQTEFENSYAIKEKNRYRLYLSGMFSDIFLFGFYVILLFLNDNNVIGFSNQIYLLIKSFILIEFLGILWQFLFFMKTDIYLFLADLFDKENLLEDSKEYLKNIVKRKKQKYNPILISFGIFAIFAGFLMIFRFAVFDIPIKLKIIIDSYNYLINALTATIPYNLKLVISNTSALIIQLFEIAFIIYFSIKKRIKKDLQE